MEDTVFNVLIGGRYVKQVSGIGACAFFQDHMSAEDTSRMRLFVPRSNDCIVQRCPMLFSVANDQLHHKHVFVANKRLAEKNAFVEHACVLAFAGGAAVGNITDTFKPLDVAIPLRVLSFAPIRLTI